MESQIADLRKEKTYDNIAYKETRKELRNARFTQMKMAFDTLKACKTAIDKEFATDELRDKLKNLKKMDEI